MDYIKSLLSTLFYLQALRSTPPWEIKTVYRMDQTQTMFGWLLHNQLPTSINII